MIVHVYGSKGYRSELDLYRAEGVTAVEAAPVMVGECCSKLFRISAPGREAFTECGTEAWDTFTAAGGTLSQVQLVWLEAA